MKKILLYANIISSIICYAENSSDVGWDPLRSKAAALILQNKAG